VDRRVAVESTRRARAEGDKAAGANADRRAVATRRRPEAQHTGAQQRTHSALVSTKDPASAMEAHRTRTTVGENGEVALRDVPFAPGDEVEVIVLAQKHAASRSAPPDAEPADAEPAEKSDPSPSPSSSETSSEEKSQTVLESGLAGLWKHRDDELPDSPEYARQLREEAQRRPHIEKELEKLNLGRDSS